MNRLYPNIDELLNSFIDGELTAIQQAEVQQLIAHDKQIARRLQQLQKIKMLVSSLPRDNAPGQITEQVKASLARRQLMAQQPVFSEREGTRQLLIRRVLAAAAMIALVAILAGVIYTIVAPQTIPERLAEKVVAVKLMPAPSEVEGPSLAMEAGFSGKLELKTGALIAVDAFINGVIEGNGLSDYVTKTAQPNQAVYSLNCSRQDINLLLADLQSIWQRFNSATLYVDTEQFNTPIVVTAVTVEQAAKILNQDSPQRYIEVAKDFAVLNSMNELIPVKQILTAFDDRDVDLIQIPKPVLTGDRKTKKADSPSERKQEVSLTIVVVGSE